MIVNPVPAISSVIYTNGGFLLTWLAPTNDIFQVQWSDNLAVQLADVHEHRELQHRAPSQPDEHAVQLF